MWPPRLLANENLPAPSIRRLREAGLEIAAIRQDSPGIEGINVLARAITEQRWQLIFDMDYGDLIFRRGHAAPPALILFRLTRYGVEEPATRLLALLDSVDARIGDFFVITEDAVRWRPFR